MDAERFGHQVSRYERPNFRYRCGRAALWGKPCARGPHYNGKCGGVAECEPYFNGQGYECRRSPAAGGPCDQGPLPDGRCSIRRPACVPRRPLRFQRRRATYLAVLLSLVALIGFAGGQDTLGTIAAGFMATEAADAPAEPAAPRHAGLSLLNPGPLTGAHGRFTEQGGCASCHGEVGDTPMAWLRGALSAHDMTGACTECHLFSGPPDSPHNLASAEGAGKLECTACHSEHKGADFDIASMPDARCHGCHEPALRFASFSRNHPPFGADYPHRAPTAIKFDHKKHVGEYFVDPRFQEKAPEACHSCHDLSRAALKVPTRGYEAMCAACHDGDIGGKALALVTWPYGELDPLTFAELDPESEAPPAEEAGVTAEALLAACGTDFDALAALQERVEAAADAEDDAEEEEDEEFESWSEEDPTVMDAFLLDIDPDDDVEYWAPYRRLMLRMAVYGKAAVAELLDERLGAGAAALHLAALDDEFVKAFGCAWAANEEFEPEEPEEGAAPPWASNGFTLEYKAVHGDPLVMDWIGRLMAAEGALQDLDEGLLEEIRAIFLPASNDGVGNCTSCHWLDAGSFGGRAPAPAEAAGGLIWRDRPSERGPVLYTHVPHINLLGRGTWCQNCHELDNAAAYGANFSAEAGGRYVSNFKPIGVDTCRDCHRAENGVRQDCLTCHEYHREPTIRERMQSHDTTQKSEN